ncbi:D-alanyl-D-alanine carboxypeptidase family protein [Breoghania sp.]|uniref:D-alanyl-D-alanine carboxypeptidase family protein n=1 Tax=Breoghania sp. TaxID=2065378 RepID=UPI002AA87518|nr:D-alanyl-D-alanine carboxypeptidase family protein [Breoghania sp.]
MANSAYSRNGCISRCARKLPVLLSAFMAVLALAVTAAPRPAHAEIAAWIVFEAGSGEVIEQHEAFRRWYPASLTKLMTAYVTFSAIKQGRVTLKSPVMVSAHAAAQPPSKMGLKAGSQLSLDAALKVMLVKSANDIAVAVAETIGGSQAGFADVMNRTARKLGMRDTHFVNPHGLPAPEHYSSVHDMALLTRALLRDFPQYRKLYGYTGVRYGKRMLRSANREYLRRVRGANGLKTGYVCNSGYNVAVSATRGGRTVVAIVFGAASGLERAAKASALIEKGFDGGGLFASHPKLDSLKRPASVKGLPRDGYCRRNAKLKLANLMKEYAGSTPVRAANSSLPGVATAYARESGRTRAPGIAASAGTDTSVPRTRDKKVDWGEVMDRLIGEKRRGDNLIRITLAIDPNAKRAVPLKAPGADEASKTIADAFGIVMPPRAKPRAKPDTFGRTTSGAVAAAPVIVNLPTRARDGTPTPRPSPR